MCHKSRLFRDSKSNPKIGGGGGNLLHEKEARRCAKRPATLAVRLRMVQTGAKIEHYSFTTSSFESPLPLTTTI